MRPARRSRRIMVRLLGMLAAAALLLVLHTTTVTTALAACTGEQSGSGFATFYHYTPGTGACSYSGDDFEPLVAAINPTDYAGSEMCGRYLRVTGPLGSVDVRIVDLCPTCATGDVKLNAAAFSGIANPLDGRVGITWKTIPAPVDGNVFLQLSAGTNFYFLQIQPRNMLYGVASLEYLGPSGYVSARRETTNYFTIDATTGAPVPLSGLFTVRVTDVNGQPLVFPGIPLSAGHLHAGNAQFPACDAADVPPPRSPRRLALHLPSPNPFRRSTVFAFDVPRDGFVQLRFYDMSGRRVRSLVNERFATGGHQVAWDGLDDAGHRLAAGMYFCRLSSGNAVDQRRIVLAD